MHNLTIHDPQTLAHTDPYAQAFLSWLGNLNSERTRQAYKLAVVEFGAFADKPIADITQDDVIRYKLYLDNERGLSQASINLKLSALSSYFAVLSERGLVQVNPVDGVKRRNVNPYNKAAVLTAADVHLCLDSIDMTTPIGKRDYAIILMFVTTALRLAELASLSVGSLKRDAGGVQAHFTGKGGASETVTVGPNTFAAVQDYLATRGPLRSSAPLWATHAPGKPEKRFERRSIQRMVLDRTGAALGDDRAANPHALRHTAAVLASEENAVGAVSKLLRHANMRVTTIYLDHIDTSKVKEAHNRLDSRFSR